MEGVSGEVPGVAETPATGASGSRLPDQWNVRISPLRMEPKTACHTVAFPSWPLASLFGSDSIWTGSASGAHCFCAKPCIFSKAWVAVIGCGVLAAGLGAVAEEAVCDSFALFGSLLHAT